MNPDDETAAELRKFNVKKSKWSSVKCSEIQDLLTLANQYPLTSAISNLTILNAGARLLCAGPKFNEDQAQQLTSYLQQMQTIFATTEVCIPKHLDVCLNLDRIWEFTYVLRGAGHLEQLNLDAVKPKMLVQCNFNTNQVMKNKCKVQFIHWISYFQETFNKATILQWNYTKRLLCVWRVKNYVTRKSKCWNRTAIRRNDVHWRRRRIRTHHERWFSCFQSKWLCATVQWDLSLGLGKLESSCWYRNRNNLFKSKRCYECWRQSKWWEYLKWLFNSMFKFISIKPCYHRRRIQWHWWSVATRSGFATFTRQTWLIDAANNTILSTDSWRITKRTLE